MKFKLQHFFLLMALFVVLTVFADMAEAQRNRERSNRRRRNNNRRRRNNRAGRNRGRGRARNRSRSSQGRVRTTTTAAPETFEGCEEIQVPMCKGLVPYTHTKLPNRFNHTTQNEVYRELEHIWAYMDHSCSVNTRVLACSLYLPKCTTTVQQMGPCKTLCMAAKRRCNRPFQSMFSIRWGDVFPCRGLPRNNCIPRQTERTCTREYTQCESLATIPQCQSLSFSTGIMPNMFHQCFMDQIRTEIQYYDALRNTSCHEHLDFFLCGVHMPFCVRGPVPFSFPCREKCEEIRAACEPAYAANYNNLPWPNKLQCHRYPSTESTESHHQCVMPGEGSNASGVQLGG